MYKLYKNNIKIIYKMKAFYVYHPDGTDIMLNRFLKLRSANYFTARQLYYAGKINSIDLDQILKLIHEADVDELEKIRPHLKEIQEYGVRIEDLRSKISKKERVPFHRENLIKKVVTEDSRTRDFWINKAKRLLHRRYKAGELEQEKKFILYGEAKLIKSSSEAEKWCDKIIRKNY